MSRGTSAPARRAASSGTAERFAARVRSRRRRRIATLVSALAVVAGIVWLALLSPYLVVEQVRLAGLDRVRPERVRQVTDGELGRPMVLLDPARLARSVAGIPLVRSVTVQRSWPGTVTVTITERVPVAAVPAAGGGFQLVDREGVEVESVVERPLDLPLVQVEVKASDPVFTASLVAALDVLESLPGGLRAQLVGVGASSPDGVWLSVRARAGQRASRVIWGDASATREKAEVLTMLVRAAGSDGASVYDVSAPQTPSVRPR